VLFLVFRERFGEKLAAAYREEPCRDEAKRGIDAPGASGGGSAPAPSRPSPPPSARPTPSRPSVPPPPSATRPSAAAPPKSKSGGGAGNFVPGARVRHPKYGVGLLLRREGAGDDAKLTVSFPGFGQKKFVARFAQLEKA